MLRHIIDTILKLHLPLSVNKTFCNKFQISFTSYFEYLFIQVIVCRLPEENPPFLKIFLFLLSVLFVRNTRVAIYISGLGAPGAAN